MCQIRGSSDLLLALNQAESNGSMDQHYNQNEIGHTMQRKIMARGERNEDNNKKIRSISEIFIHEFRLALNNYW